MKKHLLLILGITISIMTWSQSKNSFKYQAVLRDNQGLVIPDEPVTMRISILKGTETGVSVYKEEHTITTNSMGMIFLVIGEGNVASGNFNNINWGADNYFLKLELSRNSAAFITMGTSPLLSVPYAIHAKTVENADDADADPANEIQTLTIEGNTIKLTDGGSIDLPNTSSFSGDYIDLINKPMLYGDVSGELNATSVEKIQGKSVSTNNPGDGQVLKWDDGTSSWIPGQDELGAAGTTDGVAESIGITGTATKTITVNRSNSLPALTATFDDNSIDADADPTNEIQDLNLSENTLKITNNNTATAVDLSTYINTDAQNLVLTDGLLTISGGTGAINLANYINDSDADSTNELQSVFFENDSIKISNGQGAPLPNGLNLWQSDGSNVYLPSGNVGLGSVTPSGKLSVKGNAIDTPDDILFSVVNNNGDTVFAVYQGGVRIYVNVTEAKSSRGGFAVAGINSTGKGYIYNEFLRVTPDSVRIYVDESLTKASRGGFAVAGINSTGKGVTDNEFLRVTPDSVRIYVDEAITKASRGGFAVAGINSTGKGLTDNEFLRITPDSTRIYVKEQISSNQGGFAVSNLTSTNAAERFMNITKENYFIGHNSGNELTIGLYNSFIGFESGKMNSTGNSNSFLGYQSGLMNESGSNNIFLGYQTGYTNSDGDYNTFLGFQAGYLNTTGSQNTYLGSFTGNNNTYGDNNTFIGFQAGIANIGGDNNTFLGTNAGLSNKYGISNIFIGTEAGSQNLSADYNVMIGHQAGFKNNFDFNTFIGYQAGYNIGSGESNTILGYRAGRGNDVSSVNCQSNVFIGTEAGYSILEADYNVMIGRKSGYTNSTGDYNVIMGYNAGYNTNASNNIIIGAGAGLNNTSGYNNVYIGLNSGYSNTDGNNNVFIGNSAGFNASGNHKLYVANSNTDAPLIYGEFDQPLLNFTAKVGISRTPLTNALEVEGNASKTTSGTWLANSDKRIKTDILDIENSFQTILKLRPVKFKYTEEWKIKNPSIKDQYYYNFIAQEFMEVFPNSVQGSGEFIDGDPNEILQIDTYNAQIVSIKAVQELIKENKTQQEKIDKLEQEINEIKLLLKQ